MTILSTFLYTNNMTNKIKNQKDQLAKLMATEDITVVHRNIPTAYFDIKNRILACPTFKDDISNELYDLFMGHEVGHALHTPYEGVHSALEKNRTLKGYLNVVEDVRIESAIKDKFAGLRRSFYTAYNELMERDFFGIKGRNLQELSLIDKINLITKVGSRVSIQLTDEEQVFLDKCYACKTWEDVERVANEIYEWSKENETRDETDESLVPQSIDFDGDEDEDEDGTESEMDWDSEESDEELEGDSLPDLNMEGEESAEDSEENAQEGESDSEEETKSTGSVAGGKEGGYGSYDDEDGARESITEHNAHNNEGDYISDVAHIKSQIDLPKIFKDKKEEINNIEVSYKDVLNDWKKYWNKQTDEKRHPRSVLAGKHLVDKNKKLVAHMSKEFEMKQTAKRSKFATTGKTGKLDMNRLAKYQIVDDVFKRAIYLPEGQNHGVNVMLDWSGSIAKEANDLLEQTLILAMFCRKSNIPHRMYLFTDSYALADDEYGWRRDHANLLTIASDEMNNREWNEMLTIIGALWTNFTFSGYVRNQDVIVKKWNNIFGEIDFKGDNDYYHWFDTNVEPRQYGLGGTPLDQTLVAMRKLLPTFNKKYSVEKSILTVITDGYSHNADLLSKTAEENKIIEEQMTDEDSYWRTPTTRELIDPYSKRVHAFATEGRYGSRNGFRNTANLLEWLSKECGVIITGYFVLGKKRDIYDLMHDATVGQNIQYDVDSIWRDIRKSGYVLNCHGYNKLFITSASAIGVDGNDELDDELVDAKKSRVLAAFKRNQKSKSTSRFLTNEFIKEIA